MAGVEGVDFNNVISPLGKDAPLVHNPRASMRRVNYLDPYAPLVEPKTTEHDIPYVLPPEEARLERMREEAANLRLVRPRTNFPDDLRFRLGIKTNPAE